MSDFETTGKITIQPNDIVPFFFEITKCSSLTSNDGFLGFNQDVIGVNVIIYDKDKLDVTDQMVEEPATFDTNIIKVVLKYPATAGSGRYKGTFILSLTGGYTKEADFHRIECIDR